MCSKPEFLRAQTTRVIAHMGVAPVTWVQLSLDTAGGLVTGRRAQEIHSPFPWVCSAPGRIKADTISWERGAVKAAPPCSGAGTTERLL